jgi:hypothetical protein
MEGMQQPKMEWVKVEIDEQLKTRVSELRRPDRRGHADRRQGRATRLLRRCARRFS